MKKIPASIAIGVVVSAVFTASKYKHTATPQVVGNWQPEWKGTLPSENPDRVKLRSPLPLIALGGDKAKEENGIGTDVSGHGYFPNAFKGIFIAVKNSKRFADSSNWVNSNLGHHAPPNAKTAKAAPIEASGAEKLALLSKTLRFQNIS